MNWQDLMAPPPSCDAPGGCGCHEDARDSGGDGHAGYTVTGFSSAEGLKGPEGPEPQPAPRTAAMPELDKATIESGRRALAEHARAKGQEIFARYGPSPDLATLERMLEDRECVHFPARLEFDSSQVEDGMFGSVEPAGEQAKDGYVIFLHEAFRSRDAEIAPLVFYLLVAVNYGVFATARDAETFGAAAMGMEEEEYYARICALTDSIGQV